MSALIVADDIRAVYSTDLGDPALQPFIDIAVALTDAQLVLPSALLKEVQRYLAAHFLFVKETGVHASLRTEDVSETFTASRKNPGLADSRWGATAMMLDTSGVLTALSKDMLPAELQLVSRETC